MAIENMLPAEMELDGSWDMALASLYAEFCATFITNPVRFNGRKVIFDKRKLEDDKEEGFWHVISRKLPPPDLTRVPDYNRARRIHWIRILCENPREEGLVCFKYQEGSGNWRVYIWLIKLDHLVILEELDHVYKLVTAYAIDSEWQRRDLRRKSQNGKTI